MRKIMLMAEYGCYPLWDVTDGIAENISPRQLKLSDTVMIEINNWDEDLNLGYKDVDTSQTLNENPNGKQTVAKV